MIIRGGENIYPREIEEFIYTHPKVRDVQVIGVPDEQYGEEIMACIILKEGEAMTEAELKEFAPVRGLCGGLPHERGREDSQVPDAGGGPAAAGPEGPGPVGAPREACGGHMAETPFHAWNGHA